MLIPKTKKGKERIKQSGTNEWEVVIVAGDVQFSSKEGPWLLMSPSGCLDEHARWINEFNDDHFTVRDD
jgi:hypothetical protein